MISYGNTGCNDAGVKIPLIFRNIVIFREKQGEEEVNFTRRGNALRRPVLRWLPAFLWMGAIFGFSAQNGEESAGLSEALEAFLFRTGAAGPFQFVLRKGAHFCAYALLGMLCLLGARGVARLQGRWWRAPALAWGLAALYAAADELHQAFVPGRSAELRDVLLDACGALSGILLALLFLRLSRRRREGENALGAPADGPDGMRQEGT